jgi:hypothetical protein
VHAAPAADAFNDVCKFIDKFCASGHFRGSAKTLSHPQDTSIFVNFKFTHLEDEISCCYEQLRPDPSWPQCLFRWPDWLFVRKGITNMPTSALTYQDCLTPDFYVRPPRAQVHGFAQPRAIFLPRNLFCFGVGCGHLDLPGMLDISNLTLITQRDWFTVFRYHKHGDPPFIIKSAAPAEQRSVTIADVAPHSAAAGTRRLTASRSNTCCKKKPCSFVLILKAFRTATS